MTRFARNTDVSVDKTRAEIERLITRYGATATAFMSAPRQAIICFEANERRVMFKLPLPDRRDRAFTHGRVNQSRADYPRKEAAAYAAWEQACRQCWRALALVIKAKLEAVESGITTFEEEFYAHIVLPDGMSIYEATKGSVERAYKSGQVPPLLPNYSGESN